MAPLITFLFKGFLVSRRQSRRRHCYGSPMLMREDVYSRKSKLKHLPCQFWFECAPLCRTRRTLHAINAGRVHGFVALAPIFGLFLQSQLYGKEEAQTMVVHYCSYYSSLSNSPNYTIEFRAERALRERQLPTTAGSIHPKICTDLCERSLWRLARSNFLQIEFGF